MPCAVLATSAADCDFDGSGDVGFADFLAFAAAYGSTTAKYDLDGNGAVDFSDFLAFVGFYGQEVQQEPEKEITIALSDSVTMAFVYIPPGTFTMGAPNSDSYASVREKPQHSVTISKGFYLGRYEVTQAQWTSVIETETPFFSGKSGVQENPDHPTVYVSWNDVQEFCARLNEITSLGLYRLPTEAEWEYACRAGTMKQWSFGDSESRLKEYAWYDVNAWDVGEQYAHRVGTKLPNPWGLYDMHGNVWEWCQDWYGSYLSEAQTDPQGPESGESRIFRGGSFSYYAPYTRSAFRNKSTPSYRTYNVGFRVLRRAE